MSLGRSSLRHLGNCYETEVSLVFLGWGVVVMPLPIFFCFSENNYWQKNDNASGEAFWVSDLMYLDVIKRDECPINCDISARGAPLAASTDAKVLLALCDANNSYLGFVTIAPR